VARNPLSLKIFVFEIHNFRMALYSPLSSGSVNTGIVNSIVEIIGGGG